MKADKEMVKFIQNELNKRQKLSLVVDGDPGDDTQNALMHVSSISIVWEVERKLIGYIQHLCSLEAIDAGPIDGYMGPQTQYGYECLVEKMKTGLAPKPWRDDSVVVGPASQWPYQTQAELEKFYGPVGTNQISVVVPYPLTIAWATDTVVNKVTCHEKVATSFAEILKDVKNHYGLDEIKRLGLDMFGGMLNVRKMRGGSSYSTHSWGIAVDFHPEQNQLKWDHTKAAFARPEYSYWIDAFERRGWVSLGKEKDYDWMHFQACRVK